MKKTRRVARHLLSLLFLACLAGTVNAAPYGPKGRVINWVQPTGEKLTLRVYGDEFYARTETQDGYTVVYDSNDGAYHYAEIGANGRALKPSGIRAHRPAPGGKARHLDLPKDQIRRIYQTSRTKFAGEREKIWNQRVRATNLLQSARVEGRALPGPVAAAAQIQAAPVTGKKIGLTILVQFPNDPGTNGKDPVDFPTTRSKVVRFCNEDGYNDDGNTGSVRDYFYDQSLGKVTYTQSVTQIVTLPNPRNYYNYQDYPTNNVLRDAGLAGRQLITDAVGVLNSEGFDFSNLTTDADRNAIATNLFFAGPDSGVWSQGLWPHQWSLATPLSVGTSSNPVFLNAYQVTNIENSQPVIGTFVHENGHLLLNYPDLYSYIGDGEGAGDHCVMAGGSYNNDGKTPAPIDAYLKDVVGWANITDLAPADYVTKTLPTSGNVAYRILKPGSITESFYVENRGNGDKWAQYAVDKGILIWHIDATIDGNGNRDGSDPHYGVSVEQADGANDLEYGINRGDSTDAFDAIFPLFTDTTSPDANWWDGSESLVRVKVLNGAGAKTKVQFGKLPPNTIILDSPNGGEVMYRESKFNITWEANIVGNLKIDLYKGGKFLFNIADNVENSGSYKWEIPASMSGGKNFAVKITSKDNLIVVSDTSDKYFRITDSTFPEGNVMPYGWVKPADADVGWEVTDSTVYEGSHSLVSKPLGDAETAAVSYTSNFKAGTLSFYIKISSEVGYDYGSFYIDGVRQILPATTSKKGITGRIPWSFASFPIDAGNHTFKWVYTKDDSYAIGEDSVWLDGVLLPETTQEIVVNNPKGLQLTNGESRTVFPSQRIGYTSKAKTFTIKNRGKATLYGLKIRTKGENPDAFIVSSLGETELKSGQSTTFNVKFSPDKPGSKNAEIRIQSNDENESPFVIDVRGLARGIPEITVSQPADHKLKDDKSLVNFGYATVDSTGDTRVFTVKNVGSATLTDLTVDKSGSAKSNFDIRAIGSTKLAPGESTTFKVTFAPDRKGERPAALHITCSYKPAGSFDIDLMGNGAPKNAGKSAAIATASPASLLDAVFGTPPDETGGVTSTEIIDGRKYLTLTVAKPAVADGLTRTVEVSPNLIDWYSGSQHTSILTDNESFQKVRDNTPVTPGSKRFIRLRTTRP